MDLYEGLDSSEIKWIILSEIVDYGSEDISPISDFCSDSESEDLVSNEVDQEMEKEDDNEEKVENEIDRYEEANRVKFKEMFSNALVYPSAHSIYKSERLDWGLTKIKKTFKHYQMFGIFPEDQRSSNSSFKKLRSEHIEYIIQKLNENSSIKCPEITNLLNSRFDLNVSERTIQRWLKEKGYEYSLYKVRPKNDLKIQENRLNWCKHHTFDNWYDIFFTDETTIYLNNPGGFKWVKDGEQQNYVAGHNRGRKVNVWGAISHKGKLTLQVFEENLNTEVYLNILSDMLPEMRQINNKKNRLQMDNAKVHWPINALKFYKENNLGLIDWPPNSPDLNPIENVWAYLKSKLSDQKYTKNQQISKIHTTWNDISDEQIKKTWESIYKRIQQCIDVEGKLTNF